MREKQTLYIFTFLVCCTQLLYAQNYKLWRVGDSEYSPMSENEILEKLSINQNDLYQFRCDNPERFELFGYDSHFKGKDSLRVLGGDGEKYIYKNQKLINEKTKESVTLESMIDTSTGKVSDDFTYLALESLQNLEKRTLGKKLIKKMQKSPYVFYIALGGNNVRGTDATKSDEQRMELENRTQNQITNFQAISLIDEKIGGIDRIVFNSIGGSGTINFNPQLEHDFVDTKYKKSSSGPEITLAHEMYHAYDAARGLLDMRVPIYEDAIEGQPKTNVGEYRAVRFANLLRRKNKRRRFYSKADDYTEKQQRAFYGMLDSDREPIVIPTPCINWL